MSFIIKDGAGSGSRAEVDATLKLQTRSINRTEHQEGALERDAFILTPGHVQLTSDSDTAISWFRNDEQRDILLTRVTVSCTASTGGTESFVQVKTIRNPTGMTGGIGVNVFASNNNFGSNRGLESTGEIGQEGATLIGGTFGAFGLHFPVALASVRDIAIVLPRGASIGYVITPPANNTDMSIAVLLDSTLIKAGT